MKLLQIRISLSERTDTLPERGESRDILNMLEKLK